MVIAAAMCTVKRKLRGRVEGGKRPFDAEIPSTWRPLRRLQLCGPCVACCDTRLSAFLALLACPTLFQRLSLHLSSSVRLSVTKMNRYRVIIYIERLSFITAIRYMSVFVFSTCPP